MIITDNTLLIFGALLRPLSYQEPIGYFNCVNCYNNVNQVLRINAPKIFVSVGELHDYASQSEKDCKVLWHLQATE
jgi:hypothetical protein